MVKLTKDATITPTTGVFDSLDAEKQQWVVHVVETMSELFDGGDWPKAKEEWDRGFMLTVDEKVAAWSFFSARQRAYLKGSDRKYLEEK